MPLDHYVTLGNSGLRVSPLCLGAMTFGQDWGSFGASEADSKAMIDRYLDGGGNFIDTANFYTHGHSERIIGDHIGAQASLRQRVVIGTKFFCSLYTGDPNAGGGGRKSMLRACEESLRRLRTDYIDLYWSHMWDRFSPIDETMHTLDTLVQSGKVRYVGFSDTPAWKVAQAQTMATMRGWTPLIALQIEYSLVERTVEAELIPAAMELGLGVTPWSPLRGGVLTGKYAREDREAVTSGRGDWVQRALSDRTFTIVDELKRVAHELGTTPARVALAWVVGRPGVASTIIGARTLAQLEDNLGALDLGLTPEHTAPLDTVSSRSPLTDFASRMLTSAGVAGYGGTTINGETFPVNPLAPHDDGARP